MIDVNTDTAWCILESDVDYRGRENILYDTIIYSIFSTFEEAVEEIVELSRKWWLLDEDYIRDHFQKNKKIMLNECHYEIVKRKIDLKRIESMRYDRIVNS